MLRSPLLGSRIRALYSGGRAIGSEIDRTSERHRIEGVGAGQNGNGGILFHSGNAVVEAQPKRTTTVLKGREHIQTQQPCTRVDEMPQPAVMLEHDRSAIERGESNTSIFQQVRCVELVLLSGMRRPVFGTEWTCGHQR